MVEMETMLGFTLQLSDRGNEDTCVSQPPAVHSVGDE